jgi:hypothetical protein
MPAVVERGAVLRVETAECVHFSSPTSRDTCSSGRGDQGGYRRRSVNSSRPGPRTGVGRPRRIRRHRCRLGRDLVGGSGDSRQQTERRVGSTPSGQINTGHVEPGSSAAAPRSSHRPRSSCRGTDQVPVRERGDSHRGSSRAASLHRAAGASSCKGRLRIPDSGGHPSHRTPTVFHTRRTPQELPYGHP